MSIFYFKITFDFRTFWRQIWAMDINNLRSKNIVFGRQVYFFGVFFLYPRNQVRAGASVFS